jgi:hypothetical protein
VSEYLRIYPHTSFENQCAEIPRQPLNPPMIALLPPAELHLVCAIDLSLSQTATIHDNVAQRLSRQLARIAPRVTLTIHSFCFSHGPLRDLQNSVMPSHNSHS